MNRQPAHKVVHERVLRNRVIPITLAHVHEQSLASSSREPSEEPKNPPVTEVNSGVSPPTFSQSVEEQRAVSGLRPGPQWERGSAGHSHSTFYDPQDGLDRREGTEENIFPPPGGDDPTLLTMERQEVAGGVSEAQAYSGEQRWTPSAVETTEVPNHERTSNTFKSSPDLQLQLLVATVRESVRAVLASELSQASESSKRTVPSGLRAPPAFNGEGARNWLLQIETYHNLLNMPMKDRVDDAVSYLTGRALSEYALENDRGRQPRDWAEFRQWVCTRFHTQSERETVSRLMALEWDGSLDRLCARFTAILSNGVAPSNYELVRLFIRVLPPDLVVLLGSKPFYSWVEVRDFLVERIAPTGQWATVWMSSVSESRLRDAERRLPQHFPITPSSRPWRPQASGPRPDERGNGVRPPMGDRPSNVSTNVRSNLVPRANQGPSNFNNYKLSDTTCLLCKGKGHVKPQCPNAVSQCYKEGSKCSRCKGIGHWAQYCPSPVMPNLNLTMHAPINEGKRSEKERGPGQRNPNESGNGSA